MSEYYSGSLYLLVGIHYCWQDEWYEEVKRRAYIYTNKNIPQMSVDETNVLFTMLIFYLL